MSIKRLHELKKKTPQAVIGNPVIPARRMKVFQNILVPLVKDGLACRYLGIW